MNKIQLAQNLSEKVAGVTKSQAEQLLEQLTKIITQELLNGGDVVLAGFGAFSARKRKGRVGVNPRNTSEQIEIPSVIVAKFKPGKNLKDALKKKDKAPAVEKSAPEPQSETSEESQM